MCARPPSYEYYKIIERPYHQLLMTQNLKYEILSDYGVKLSREVAFPTRLQNRT